VPEESQPKVCEGAIVVTVSGPSIVPLGSYLYLRTFVTKNKGLGGNQLVDKKNNTKTKTQWNFVMLLIKLQK
jgi:hypothetical protein